MAEEANTYLIVSLGDSLYGIDSMAVEEVFLLPELTPIAEASREIAGVVNLRGTILPVVDLNLRLGYQATAYQITDSIVVLNWQGRRLGAIVNRVRDVQTLESAAIDRQWDYGREAGGGRLAALSEGIARSGDEIIVVLAADVLTQAAVPAEPAIATLEEPAPEAGATLPLAEQRRFFPEATPTERETLRARAASLRQATASQETQGFRPLAAIRLGQEIFGIDLRLVREFAELANITPIPCCPPHIVGNTNLRGEIVTLVDISAWLQLPGVARSQVADAAIVQVDDLVVGLVVDEVLDVLLLNPAEISNVPTALHAIDDEYLQGAAPYGEGDRLMSLLDLAKLLHQGNLTVDEMV